MLDDIEFMDDATRPKAPKLEGLTAAQRAPGRHLKMVHDHLRENMVAIGALIEAASVGSVTLEQVQAQTADFAILNNYRRFGNLCGQHCQIVNTHHSIEDYAVFPEISKQGEAFRKVAERLQAEHVVVHELLERQIDALNALAREPSSSRFEDATQVYEALGRVLLSHLGYEEEEIGDALGYFRIGV